MNDNGNGNNTYIIDRNVSYTFIIKIYSINIIHFKKIIQH